MISAFSTYSMIRQQVKQKLGRPLGGNDKIIQFGNTPARATSNPMGSIGMMGAAAAPVAGPNGDNGGAFSPNIYTGSSFVSNQNAGASSAFQSSPMGGALMLERNKPVELSQQRPIDTSAYAPVKYSGGLV